MAKLVPGINDLATQFPELAKEVDGWDPSTVVAGSGKKMPWKCKKNHKWIASVAHRSSGRGCPFCSGFKVLEGFNDLQTKFPEIAKEANGWNPSTVAPGSVKKLSWKCSKGHQWETSPNSRTNNRSGCPFCSNRKVFVGFNDLKTRFPDIASEADGWDPSTVIAGSHQKMSWQCKEGHKWIAVVNSRTTKGGRGCPYCGNHIAGYGNDLKTKYPQIADEWDYKKNKTKPEEHTRRSGKKVWWICTIGHSYDATIDKRVSDRGCPYCKLTPRSKEEIYLLFELKYFFDIDPEDTKIKLSKVESVDIKINEINTIVEYDGAYWHQDRALKDSSKTKELEKLGWIVVRVREKPLKLNNKKFDISTKPKEYKETANKTLRKLKSLGNDIKELNKYLERKTLINKKEADQYINKLLLKKKKNSVS